MDSRPSFASLLRHHRLAAGVSQGKLAEQAGLSTRGIADLERGARRFPYRDTVVRLADALELVPSDRAVLLSASERPAGARSTAPVEPPCAAEPGEISALLGRDDELELLRAALHHAIGGRGRMILISGEPGIGKTRLCEELARDATAAGVRVCAGACYESDSAPPFWPWVQVVRCAVRANGVAPDGVSAESLLRQLGDDPASSLLADHDRFWLFDAVSQFWVNVARRQPTLLLFEDLHWSDPTSLLLLRFISTQLRDARLLIVGTYRDVGVPTPHPLERILPHLTSENRHLRLTGLNEQSVGDFVAALTGKSPDAASLASLHRQTGGNPLFVRELARTCFSAPAPEPAFTAHTIGLPNVIRRRVGRVSPRCAQLLSLAAVIGAQIDASLLHIASGPAIKETRSAIDEALESGLLERTAEPVAGYRFMHALVRDVVYAELAPHERAALHEQVVKALINHPRYAHAEPVDDLAYHFSKITLETGAQRETAAVYAERAGQRALDALAYESAAEHFEAALCIIGNTDLQVRGRLLLALARARMGASDVAAAQAAYAESATLARHLGLTELLIQVALEFGLDFTTGLVDTTEVQLLEEALAVVGPGDSAARARVLARLAGALRFCPNVQQRRELSTVAITMARRIGDPLTVARVLLDVHLGNWVVTDAQTRRCMATEAIASAQQCGDDVLALEGRSLLLGDLLDLGDIHAFRIEVEAYERLVNNLRQARLRWHIPLLQATLATLEGRFDDAEQLAQCGLRLGQQAQQQGALTAAPAVLCALRFAQGRADELEPLARERTRHPAALPAWRAVLAYALCERGRCAEAQLEFELLATEDFAQIPRDSTWFCNLALLSLSCARLGDVRRAEVLYELVLPFVSYVARPTRFGAGCLGSMAHYAGLLAGTLGLTDAAVHHFEAALQMHSSLGARTFVANSRYHLARALRARGAPGDLDRSDDELAKAESAAGVLDIRFHLRELSASAS